MRQAGSLIGFANVAWDGGVHTFLLDTMVATTARKKGYGKKIVEEVLRRVKTTACEWLHVDFEPHLRDFYFDACGFRPTDGGVIRLQ